MDTKSKKFDRTWITKPIAFLLAVALAAFACVYTVCNAQELEKNVNGAGVFARDILQGADGEHVTRMWSFANENRTLQTYALQRYLYGDGSKEAYESYQKHQKAVSNDRLEPMRNTILQNCAGESSNGSPAAIFAYLPEGMINLRKLGEHETHFVPGGATLTVNGEGEYLTDEDSNMEPVFEYDGEDFYGTDGSPTEAYTTMAPENETSSQIYPTAPEGLTNPQSVNGSDYEYQSHAEIPQEIQAQLKDGEIAVELCRTRWEYGGNFYDGYYALSVNETQLYSLYSSRRTNYGSAFASYGDFQTAYTDMRRLANQYKNMLFAVVDGETGIAVSNVAELDGKQLSKNDLRPFTNSKWNYRVDLLTGSVTCSAAAQEDMTQSPNLEQSMRWFLQTGELNGTLYVTFDEALAEHDAFSNLLTDYTITANMIKQTAEVDLLCLAGILVCVIYLVIRAGRRHDDDALHMLKTDRIFTLLRTVLNLGAACGFGGITVLLLEEFSSNWSAAKPLLCLAIAPCAAAIMALLLDWVLYLARHIKNRSLISNFFLVWLVKKIKAALAAKPVVARDLLNDILRRVLLMGFLPNFIMGLLIVLRLTIHRYGYGLAFFLILLIFAYDVFLAFYICRYAYSLRTVIAAVHQVREGDLNVQLDTAKMPPPVKAFADDVTALQQGLQLAVERAIKEERTKTELITNVSHDLKTPLTSIINYVDLLGRCGIEDETAKEYLAVLSEKSERLKKLIEDLVEASKASAGAVKVELTTVSLGELAAQLAGEYADSFAARDLQLVLQESETPILVRADGKLSYRVLDNLMGNVNKYAMPGTRVYLTLEQQSGRGVITLRNVSEAPLGVPVEELRERFVRGDASRSTEGSGLGLSIAEDLCRLQGAALTLSVSGDLFTASVAFELA